MTTRNNVAKGQLQLKLDETYPGKKQGAEALERAKKAVEMDNSEVRMARQEEDLRKKTILEREKENFTQILAMKCYNGWLKLYDNSAMILEKLLAGRLGRPYEHHSDGGYGPKALYGAISIPPESVEDFLLRMSRAGFPIAFEDTWKIEFHLGERVSKEEMVKMLHEDELIFDRVNKLVMPKEILVGLRAAVKVLINEVHQTVRNQKESTKNIFLYDVERRAVEVNKSVIATTRGRKNKEACLNEIGQFVEIMYEDATTMADLRLITAKQYKGLVDSIKHVEGEQSREVKRDAIAKAEKKAEETKMR